MSKRIKPNIRLLDGVTGPSYHVTKRIQSTIVNKSFSTLEEAENFIKELTLNAKKRDHDYPLDVIDMLFGDDDSIDIDYIENNFDKNLESVLETLREREARMFRKIWKDGYILEAVAQQEGVTKERVRQIVAKAGRRLRHPARLRVLRYGKEVMELQDDITKLTMELYQKKLELIHQIENPELITLTEEDKLESIKVEALEFSVRTYHCLKRAGINKLVDLLTKTEEDIMRLRNMGRKSLKEIVDKLSDMNLSLKRFDTVKMVVENEANKHIQD